ncbi:MAG TPA: hypothetical protein VMB82_03845, partial [Acidimicrobiales bacterium]|nr:hypothetical protein [Acidimicrobiales bacterium]
WQSVITDIAWVAGGAGLTLAWIAAVLYLVPARRALREGRAARRPKAQHHGTGGPREVGG